ncbi:MAG: VWA domain-containing protein [Magnetococcales bacterium]|nr:VWA domain-containing protein [Magnetococcales bacterium]
MMESFHFLRPHWLWCLIPLALILWSQRRQIRSASAWHTLCDRHLLPALMLKKSQKSSRWATVFNHRTLTALLGVVSILALAGPSWTQTPQPLYRAQSMKIIALDLSRSMLAEDLAPTRLVRAKQKVRDLLQRWSGTPTALIAFAGDAHVVAPPTDDIDTLSTLLRPLAPDLMPKQASRPDTALKAALKILDQTHTSAATVLLITDGDSRPEQTRTAARTLMTEGHELLILGVGSRDGAPIPRPKGGFYKDAQGKVIFADLDTTALAELAAVAAGRYATLSADESDLNRLLTGTTFHDGTINANEEQITHIWRDEGPWLILFLLPLALLAFRRGLFFSITPLVGILFLMPEPAYAFSWQDLWSRPDQQTHHHLQQNDTASALATAPDATWRGVSEYRAGNYDRAATAFSSQNDADGHFNRGNALAWQGKIEEAVKAYDEALNRSSDHTDARHNRDRLNRWLEEKRRQEEARRKEQEKQEKQNQQEKQEQEGDTESQEKSDDSSGEEQKQPSESGQSGQDQESGDRSDSAAGDSSGNDSGQQSGQKSGESADGGDQDQESKEGAHTEEQGGENGTDPSQEETKQQSGTEEDSTPQDTLSSGGDEEKEDHHSPDENPGSGRASRLPEEKESPGDSSMVPMRDETMQEEEDGPSAEAPPERPGYAPDHNAPSPAPPPPVTEPDGEGAGAGNRSEQETVDFEDRQRTEMLLKRVPDDPGGLLRTKFKRQYLRQHGQASRNRQQQGGIGAQEDAPW